MLSVGVVSLQCMYDAVSIYNIEKSQYFPEIE